MANYQTLFDASTVPFGYGSAASVLLFSAIAIGWGFRRVHRMDYNFFADYRTFKATALIVVGAVMFMAVGHNWWEHQSMQTALSRGEGTEEVEGIVQDHWVKEQTRDTNDKVRIETIEHFRVAQIDFEFAQTKSQNHYFTNAADHALMLQNGMRLRIAYVEVDDANKIVKLEIAR